MLHCSASRPDVDQQGSTPAFSQRKRIFQRECRHPVPPRDREKLCPRAGAGMRIYHAPIDDHETLGTQRLEPDLKASVRNRAFNPCRDQPLEDVEQDSLHIEGQREQAIEKGGDRRKFVFEAIVIHERQAGHRLECRERATCNLAARDEAVELAQRIAGIEGFQIVFGAEHILSARLSLSARDRSQRVKAPRDRRDEALLRLYVGRHGTEQWRLLLVRAVGSAKALDRGVGLPPRFEQIMDAAALVFRAHVGVIAAPCPASLGEDKDLLLIVHEGMGLADVCRSGPVLDRETSDAALRHLRDDPARPPRDLRHLVGPEMLDDLVEGARHRR